MKKILIIIGLLLGGTALALVVVPDITTLNFRTADFGFATTATEFTADDEGKEIRTSIKIPITYNYPVANGTGFVIESVSEDITMNLDSYDKCRDSGKTKTVCTQELNDDIVQTKEAFKINKERELKELQMKSYDDELTF